MMLISAFDVGADDDRGTTMEVIWTEFGQLGEQKDGTFRPWACFFDGKSAF